MTKTYKIILGLLILMIGWFIYAEATRPKPLDWRPTYSHYDKIPLGTYVFYHSLKKVAPTLQNVNEPPYKFLEDSTLTGTYVFVNHDIQFNKAVTKRLFHWVEKGNTIFVSAYTNKAFLDTLEVEVGVKRLKKNLTNHAEYNLVNPFLKNDSTYLFKHDAALEFFNKIDTNAHTVLGEAKLQSKSSGQKAEVPNFIEIPMGKGEVFLHTSPQVFSNFFMLHKHNYEYVEKLLAYLDLNKPVYYDVYHDPTKTVHTSPLYILLNNRYLKWAYYLLIIAVILFVIFEGKRKQKAIKVVEPPKNMSYDYTRTIAGMYLNKKDHAAIAHKMIGQFLNYIRVELRTDVDKIDKELIDRLEELTHNPREEIKALFEQLNTLQKARFVSEKELKSLNKNIINFKHKTYDGTGQ